MTELGYSALHTALDRAMQAHPPTGKERALHPDADALAGLWARMLLERLDAVPLDTVKPAVRAAFERWRGD